jgi:hypothetical protein
MNTANVGRQYEEVAYAILLGLGFSPLFYVNVFGESRLPYDFIGYRQNKVFFIEVRGSSYVGRIPFAERKFHKLQRIGNCLLLLILRNRFKLMTLQEALESKVIKLVSAEYIREYQKQRRKDPEYKKKHRKWSLAYYYRNKDKYELYRLTHRAEQNKIKLRWAREHKDRYKKLCPICKKNYFWDVPASDTTKRFKRRQMCRDCYLKHRIIMRDKNGRIVDIIIPKEILTKLGKTVSL